MKKSIYGYDVYYRLKTSSCVLVAASSITEAKKEFENWFQNASRQELCDRFLAALNFDPDIQITFVDKVDKLDENEMPISITHTNL